MFNDTLRKQLSFRENHRLRAVIFMPRWEGPIPHGAPFCETNTSASIDFLYLDREQHFLMNVFWRNTSDGLVTAVFYRPSHAKENLSIL